MTNLRDRFQTLDVLEAPSQWADITSRASIARPLPQRVLLPVFSALALLIVAVVAASLVVRPAGPGGVTGSGGPASSPSQPVTTEPARPGAWIAVGSLSVPLDGPAVRLADGTVLVAGGHQGPERSAAELYLPGSGTWAATGSMIAARRGHTATLLPDGRVLVAGGSTPEFAVATAELYDPRTGTWTATGSMLEPRTFHTATLLDDGTVLVAGGTPEAPDGRSLASAELYDPRTGSWTAVGSMHDRRAAHAATLLLDGRVLVVGGDDVREHTRVGLTSAELYDPRTGAWLETGSTHGQYSLHDAILMPYGQVLVAQGWSFDAPSAELYDPSTGSWRLTSPMAKPQWGATVTLLQSGTVLVAGGADCNGDPCFTSRAQLYNPGSDTWTATGSLLGVRKFHSATLLLGGTVLVTGGSDGHAGADWDRLATAELYDPYLRD